MTAHGFLGFVAAMRGLHGLERTRRIGEAVERTQLEEVLHRPIETLSKGFKRRVGLAQAILHDPPVLVLDEPTDGLDPNQKHEVRRLIGHMAEDKAIIISTHILEEVDAVCTRAIDDRPRPGRGRRAAGRAEAPLALPQRGPAHGQRQRAAEGSRTRSADLRGVEAVEVVGKVNGVGHDAARPARRRGFGARGRRASCSASASRSTSW